MRGGSDDDDVKWRREDEMANLLRVWDPIYLSIYHLAGGSISR
jgi:hypothetical protein